MSDAAVQTTIALSELHTGTYAWLATLVRATLR